MPVCEHIDTARDVAAHRAAHRAVGGAGVGVDGREQRGCQLVRDGVCVRDDHECDFPAHRVDSQDPNKIRHGILLPFCRPRP